MPRNAPVVLLTRPRTQAEEFRQLLGGGCEVVISPIIEIQAVEFNVDPDTYHSLIFASQNAVQMAGRSLDLRGRRAVTVGGRSAKAARDLGMDVMSAGGNADDLVACVIARKPPGRVLFLRGRHSRGDVEKRLKNAGIDTDSAIVYEQVEQPLTQQARVVLGGDRPVIMPVFSPRSAQLLGAEVAKISGCAEIYLIAMSDAVLGAWGGPPSDRVDVADHPNAAAMAKQTLRRIALQT